MILHFILNHTDSLPIPIGSKLFFDLKLAIDKKLFSNTIDAFDYLKHKNYLGTFCIFSCLITDDEFTHLLKQYLEEMKIDLVEIQILEIKSVQL